jgi:hypothetical protein
MARVNVPEQYFEGIAKILSLADEVFQELLGVFAKLPVKLYPKGLLAKAISGVRGVPPDSTGIITNAVLSLCMNRARSDKNTLDYVSEVTQSIEESGSKTLRLSTETKEVLRSRFAKILDVKPLAVSAKATSILFEYERSFSSARILTDIRPVFDAKADSPPDAAIVVHTLSIHYHQDGHKEFFVAMDDEDVQMLLDALERAKVKAKSLKQTLVSAKITCVDKS